MENNDFSDINTICNNNSIKPIYEKPIFYDCSI